MNHQHFTARDFNPLQMILRISKYLQNEGITRHPSHDFLKLSSANENSPIQEFWFENRAASILLKIYKNEGFPLGQRRISKMYRTTKNRGTRPNKGCNTSRSIIRHVLQQLTSMGLIKRNPAAQISPLGKSVLSKLSYQMAIEQGMIENVQ